MKKRLQAIDFQDELYACGYVRQELNDIYFHTFDSPEDAARYLGCSVSSIYRYLQEGWPVALARLMLIKHRGFMPTSRPWSGFKITNDKLITPTGREFSAQDLTIPKMIETNENWRLILRNQKRLRWKR